MIQSSSFLSKDLLIELFKVVIASIRHKKTRQDKQLGDPLIE